MGKKKKPKPTWQNGNDAMKQNKPKKKRIPPQTWQDGDDAMKHGGADLVYNQGIPPHNTPDRSRPKPTEHLVVPFVRAAEDGQFSRTDIANLTKAIEAKIQDGGLPEWLLRERIEVANGDLAHVGNIYRLILRAFSMRNKPTHTGTIVSYHVELGIMNTETQTEVGEPAILSGKVKVEI